jgi:ATP-binding cassette subfamily C protein
MARTMRERWTDLQEKAVGDALHANDWTGTFSSFTRAFRLFLQSAVLAVGAWLVLEGAVTAGAMIAASILLGRALAPVEVAVSQWQVAQRARSGWRDIQELLQQHLERHPATELPVPAAKLDVRGVTVVSRAGEKPVLQQITFEIAPGEAVGVIGRSGSGKTTLARVLVGLLSPSAGEVRLDGAKLGQFGPERLGRFIGYLPQDVRLFSGTIAENIAHMEMPESNRVVSAARKARVHDIILKLPDGYDTRLAAADVLLSGGQKQRLALARALYHDPVLLVLDEPNSALDADGSDALNAVVAKMKEEGRAVLIMTHRPTAISACDRLLVLDDGKMAGYGARDDIIKAILKNAGDVHRVVNRGAPQ